MSIAKAQLISSLSPPLPQEIIENLINEYLGIKQSLILSKYSPSELNGGRFAECIIRLIQHLDNPPFTPFGQQLPNVDQIIRRAEGNTSLHDSERFYVPRLSRILLDIRNRRDVAHVGGDVSPNYSDSLFVSQVADWVLVELIRIHYNCHINDARKVIESINQVHVPVVFNSNGFLKVQNSSLSVRNKVLVLLYYKKPENVLDNELQKWIKYSNGSRFRKDILEQLDNEALVHYEKNTCILTSKGVSYVEKNLNLEISV